MEEPRIAQRSPIVMEIEPGRYAWCRCGLSAKQPFCDGSHAGTSFSPEIVEITEKRRVAWCACKRSGGAPFCDGAHKDLPAE